MKKIRKAKDGMFWYLGAPCRTRRSPIKIYKTDKNKKLTKEDMERLKASAIKLPFDSFDEYFLSKINAIANDIEKMFKED